MEEHEAGRGRSDEGEDVGGGELVDTLEIPDGQPSLLANPSMK